jgi:hypothetical protein
MVNQMSRDMYCTLKNTAVAREAASSGVSSTNDMCKGFFDVEPITSFDEKNQVIMMSACKCHFQRGQRTHFDV